MLSSINEIENTFQIIQNLKSKNSIPIYKSIQSLNLNQRKYYYSINHKKQNIINKQNKIRTITRRIKTICQETNYRYGIRKIKYIYFIKHKKIISFELTRQIMKTNQLNCRIKRYNKKRKRFYQPIIQKNLIQQNFKAFQPFQKLFSDITEFRINNQKIYYATIIDSYNNQILASQLSTKNNTKLLIKLLNKIKKPKKRMCYFHTDRGGNYTSHKFQKLLIKKNYIPSMSKAAHPNDNAVIENFFSIMKGYFKKPTIYKLERFANFYNNNWILSKLNNQSPIEFLSNNNFKKH
jgi:putative transposase